MRAYVAGTCDTKLEELRFVRDLLRASGHDTCLVDVGIRSSTGLADVSPRQVAAWGQGAAILEEQDRGRAVTAMAEAFAAFMRGRDDVGGLIGLGGSGNTCIVSAAMRALPIGVPKVMVSTLTAGDTASYVGESDLCLVNPVTDIAGLNRISRTVLANAAHALGGMIAASRSHLTDPRLALGLTMFGVTTPCVTAIRRELAHDYDCVVFHATGSGGRAMERLLESGQLAAVIDITTTEIADLLCGGICSAGEGRLGAAARTGAPYVCSLGALDMVNFGAWDTVPDRYRGRRLHRHNPHVTLMRTSTAECAAIGRWIGERLNRCAAPVRVLFPAGGVSALDAPGQPFHDPDADAALFAAIEASLRQTPDRRIVRSPHHINHPLFAAEAVACFRAIAAAADTARSAHA